MNRASFNYDLNFSIMKKYILSILTSAFAIMFALPVMAQYDDMYYSAEDDVDTYYYEEEDNYDDLSYDNDVADETDYYYYDDDYNSSMYSNRIRRFQRSNVVLNYYDPFYTSFYSPYTPGTNVFISLGRPGFVSRNYYNNLIYRNYYRNSFYNNPFAFSNPWARPFGGFGNSFGRVGGFGVGFGAAY